MSNLLKIKKKLNYTCLIIGLIPFCIKASEGTDLEWEEVPVSYLTISEIPNEEKVLITSQVEKSLDKTFLADLEERNTEKIKDVISSSYDEAAKKAASLKMSEKQFISTFTDIENKNDQTYNLEVKLTGFSQEFSQNKEFPHPHQSWSDFLEERNIQSHELAGLAIDGGGIRGVLPSLWLKHLESVSNRSIHQIFDVVGGTSIGGILSLGLTTRDNNGKPRASTSDMIDLFKNHAQDIFPTTRNVIVKTWNKMLGLFWYYYNPAPLESRLKAILGEKNKLKNSLTNSVVISLDSETNQPFIFKSREAALDPRKDYHVWQVGRSTSAAPTYFPAFKPYLNETMAPQPLLIDGGLYHNNPGLEVFFEMHKVAAAQDKFTIPDKMIILSLGTGRTKRPVHPFAAKGGLLSSILPAVESLMETSSIGVHNHLFEHLEPNNYKRVNVALDEEIKLDDIDSFGLLETLAEQEKDEIENFYENRLKRFLDKRN